MILPVITDDPQKLTDSTLQGIIGQIKAQQAKGWVLIGGWDNVLEKYNGGYVAFMYNTFAA